jgi:hypothetical protein
MEGFVVTVTLAAVFGLGWAVGSSSIANECQKLGSFYVGKTVYECKVKGTE